MRWSTRGAETAALALVGLALASAVPLLDPPGRVLVGPAALLALALAARDRLLRPRLEAGPDGVSVRTLGGTLRLPWGRLRVRVRDTRRLGLRSRLLELDAAGPEDDGALVLLARRDLGRDPAEVARVLARLDPTTPGGAAGPGAAGPGAA